MMARRRVRLAAFWTALAGWLVLLPAGCGPCERPSERAAAGPAGPPAPGGAPAPSEEAQAERPLPEAGTAVVEISERGVTVLANDAPQGEVLQLLEKEVGFRLQKRRARLERKLTLSLVDLPIEEVLSQLLVGMPYDVRYRARRREEGGGHFLALVGVGRPEQGKEGRAGRAKKRMAELRKRRQERQREQERRRAELSPEELEKLEAERRAEEARLASELEDPDEWVRAEAVRRVAPEGEGEEVLNELLARDPSPQVRAAAAHRLGAGDSFSAVDALLKSLNDPSPEVVISALDSLEDLGDESIIPKLQGVLNHPNPEVREAAIDAIEFLE